MDNRDADQEGTSHVESKEEQMTDVFEDLQDATGLSLSIVTLKNAYEGDYTELSRQNQRLYNELAQSRTVEGEFPGSRQRAMGHALVYIEDLAELDIDAEREYIGHSDFYIEHQEDMSDELHRVNIHIEPGDN